MIPTPSVQTLGAAAANAFDAVFRGGIADLRPTPSQIIDEGPQRTLHRYLPTDEHRAKDLPVLLVPPLAAPTRCFDLRRGNSLAEHLLATGHPTYLLEYCDIAFGDRELGLEHWVDEVIPTAVEAVSDDAGGRPVQLVGWCLGGIMSALAVADRNIPVRSLTMVASPFDFSRGGLMGTLRPLFNLTGGHAVTPIYKLLGGAPAPLVKRGFQLSSIDKHLTKPWALARNLHDRDYLAQVEAVDHFIDNMHAYPGRTMGQLYHQVFRVNDLADGRLRLGDHDIDLAAVRVPVLAVAGKADTLAPRAAVHHVARLLVNAPDVQCKTGPGGHLGVLTGRAAQRTTWRWIDEFFARNEDHTEALEAA
jgi:polyhydroxyalkanoate synthase subunit PhaC